MAPNDKPTGPVRVTTRDVAVQPTADAAQEAPQIMMMRDEKDQVLDWLFASCKSKNQIINDLNLRLQATQKQSQELVKQIQTQAAEIDRLTAIVHPPQPEPQAGANVEAPAKAPEVPTALTATTDTATIEASPVVPPPNAA